MKAIYYLFRRYKKYLLCETQKKSLYTPRNRIKKLIVNGSLYHEKHHIWPEIT